MQKKQGERVKIFYGLGLGFISFLLVFGVASMAQAATLTLSPASTNLVVGQTLSVDILLDTKGAAVDGVDVYSLHYNPAILSVVDANTSVSGVQITPGVLLPVTLTNTANASTGVIQFSQVTSGGNTYTGSGKLATVNFYALASGTSSVTFDFTNGSTSDSNVAGGGQDKLTSVVNGLITVSGSTVVPPPPPAPVPPPTPTPPPVYPPAPTPTPSPLPSPTPSYPIATSFTRSLTQGTSGGDVVYLQTLLSAKNYLASNYITGYFGTITLAAVKKYQCDKTIVCSGDAASTGYGSVGPRTQAALTGSGSVTPTPSPTPTPTGGVSITRTLYYGMRGDDIKRLQEYFIANGRLTVTNNTGYFGVLTRASVRKYQCDKNIVCTGDEASTGYGLVGPRTRAALAQ